MNDVDFYFDIKEKERATQIQYTIDPLKESETKIELPKPWYKRWF